MIALTEPAPPPRKSRAQRRREQREASRSPGSTGLQPMFSGGTGLRPVAPAAFPGGTGVPPVSSPSQSESLSPGLPPRLGASAAKPAFTLDALITDYLNDSFTLPELAARHSLSLPELCDILESPEFTGLLERLGRLAEKRAQAIATHTRAGALATLESVCATAINPETARKAAAALIRASDRVLYPARSRAAKPTAPGGTGVGAADHPCGSESQTSTKHASQSTTAPPPTTP